MAYADKITTMRRMAIIVKNHNIKWEGVNIEGLCLLRHYAEGYIMVKTKEELAQWLESENGDRLIDELPLLEIKYQDPENEKHWEPRKGDILK